MNTITHKCFYREFKHMQKEKKVIRCITDNLEIIFDVSNDE